MALLLPVLACSHTVVVHSDPPGARIWVDGRERGHAPVQFVEEAGVASHRVHAELPGHTPVELEVERSELSWTPALGVLAASALCSVSLCAVGALLANPAALGGIVGGWVLGCINPGLGCQVMCAGCSLLQVSPSTWTGVGMIAGGLLGWLPVGSLWWLAHSPDQVLVRFSDPSTSEPDPGVAF